MSIVFCLLTTLWLAAGDLGQLTARLEQAFITGSEQQLQQVIQGLGAEAEAATPLNRYTLAYAHWRLGQRMIPKDPKASERHFQQARDILEALVQSQPGDAEAWALLSSVYGMQIGSNMWKGMTLGPKAGSAIEEALRLEPNNPRVALQSGVGAFHTPRMFGGGADKAEKELQRAEELFRQEDPGKAWPHWGRLDLLAWQGQLLAARGDKAGARAAYEQALAMQPDFAWVKYALLPALDKAKDRK